MGNLIGQKDSKGRVWTDEARRRYWDKQFQKGRPMWGSKFKWKREWTDEERKRYWDKQFIDGRPMWGSRFRWKKERRQEDEAEQEDRRNRLRGRGSAAFTAARIAERRGPDLTPTIMHIQPQAGTVRTRIRAGSFRTPGDRGQRRPSVTMYRAGQERQEREQEQ